MSKRKRSQTSKLCADQKCDRKGESLPLGEFHRDSSRKDGRHHHCKRCKARQKAELWSARKNPEVQRKPSVRVYSAIEQGHRTREQIEAATGLDEDEVADALARLYDTAAVKIRRVLGEAEFHLAA